MSGRSSGYASDKASELSKSRKSRMLNKLQSSKASSPNGGLTEVFPWIHGIWGERDFRRENWIKLIFLVIWNLFLSMSHGNDEFSIFLVALQLLSIDGLENDRVSIYFSVLNFLICWLLRKWIKINFSFNLYEEFSKVLPIPKKC